MITPLFLRLSRVRMHSFAASQAKKESLGEAWDFQMFTLSLFLHELQNNQHSLKCPRYATFPLFLSI